MEIYNKNQASVSQNHRPTKDCSQLSNEEDDVLSPEQDL